MLADARPGEMSKRAACTEYGIHWDTLTKILTHAEPPGYRRTKPRSSKLEPFLTVIHKILESDRKVHRKQRHTAQRIFERLRDEHDYDGGVTIVKDAVREWRTSHREVFLPLSHPPGEAQVDYGYADVFLNGELTKVTLFVMTLLSLLTSFDAVFGRDLHAGVSTRMHRVVSGRPQAGVYILQWRADSH